VLETEPEASELPTANRSVVRVIERVLELNRTLRRSAPSDLADRVWLYPVRTWGKTRNDGRVAALTSGKLGRAAAELISEFDLRDDQGEPLRVNVSRLRKTFVNRVSEILGGDMAMTALAAGNSPKVAGTYYLRPGENAEKNWHFLGTALVSELLTNTLGATEITPTGRCTDLNNGQYAPKRTGATCTEFLNCLRCKNYVVTADDLYRLFSFYWRVLEERSRIERRRWNQQLAHIPRLIERDVIEAGIAQGIFRREQVEAARERARSDRHPFWATPSALDDLGGLA
jgi:hypothetical protein